ncbi:general secretion pathway protein GspK [Tsuneonella sp. HG222]
MKQIPPGEDGTILINVLVIVMLATSILAVMIAGDDGDMALAIQMREVAQAQATAKGAELSAVVALRRDLVEGSESDSRLEAWGAIAENDRKIDNGTFDFVLTDAQDRFNLNNLARGDLVSRSILRAIVAQLGLPAERETQIAGAVIERQGLRSLNELEAAGVPYPDIVRLATLATALPPGTTVNLNSAPPELVTVLVGNAGRANAIVARREREILTDRTLAEVGSFTPPGAGTTSSYFWSRAGVTIGRSKQRLTTLLYRRSVEGVPQAVPLRRWRGAPPLGAPPLP